LAIAKNGKGLDDTSPSFGFRPALPWNITACDSINLVKKFGLYTSKLTFGTVIK